MTSYQRSRRTNGWAGLYFYATAFSGFFFLGCSAAQPEPVQAVISSSNAEVDGYKADLIELSERIRSDHPRPFEFVPEESFDALISSHLEAMDSSTTKADFLWAFTEVIASIGCGHSNMPYFNQQDALVSDRERFPLDVRLVGDRLLVIDPMNNSERLSVGNEIQSINGRSVQDLIEEIRRHISIEGVAETSLPHIFNIYATAYITYALDFPETYQVKRRGDSETINLRPLTDFTYRPIVHPDDPCQDRLCYRVDSTTNAAILTIRSFAYYGEDGQIYADFIDNALSDASENDRSALIIDVRGNGGGSGNSGAYVLRRLSETSFNYWSDQTDERAPESLWELQRPNDVGIDMPVHLIVDGNTGSSVPHFAALFKEHEMGTVYGEAMGGGKSTTDGARQQQSSAHGVEYKIATMRFDVEAPSLPIGEPVRPDVVLSYTEGDVINGEDSFMAFVLDKVAEQAE